MTPNAIRQEHEPGLEPVDVAVDHVRGSPAGRLIVEYGDLRRDVQRGIASGEVLGTPTLFIDGVVHRGGYDTAVLLEALAR
jgi:glutaredoxin